MQITSVVKTNNMAFKISSPFHMENKQCETWRKEAVKLDKEVKSLRADSKKTGKVTNWDAKADELSRVRERIATNCKK